jgi:hypothetical protein
MNLDLNQFVKIHRFNCHQALSRMSGINYDFKEDAEDADGISD